MEARVRERTIYQAKIVRDGRGIRFSPDLTEIEPGDRLHNLSFEQGSKLFSAAIKGLLEGGYTPIQDEGTELNIALDPFGILSGRDQLPWQFSSRGFQAVEQGCFRCEVYCVRGPDGGLNCSYACWCEACK